MIFKCKMCGGDLNITEGATVCECEYCGTSQTVPAVDNEKKMNLFNRANRLRFNNEFDSAAGVFQSIVSEFPEEAEAYWGLCLCKYGIEYVDDPETGKKIPTCHRTSFESIADDSNFELALEYADGTAKRLYREEAKEIDRIQRSILDIVKNEAPYDIFICYKETAEDGERTKDSVLAQDMYDALTEKGYKVFFARITLEDKLGQEYEPYIFAALTSAKIMLAVGTDYEYFNAVWVKNEWSRFLDLTKSDKSKVLIPCYADIDPFDMPKEFKNLQGQDMGKIGFIQDLLRGVGKILKPKEESSVVVQQVVSNSNPTVDSLLERAFMYLEDQKWSEADSYCEKVLDIEPKNVRAYIGKLLSEKKLQNFDALSEATLILDNSDNYKKILTYGDESLKCQLTEYSENCRIRYEEWETRKNKELEKQKIREKCKMEDISNYLWDYIDKTEIISYKGDAEDIYIPAMATKISYFGEKFKIMRSITIPDNVTHIDIMSLCNCDKLEKIEVLEGNKTYCSVNGILYSKDMSKIIFYPKCKKDKSLYIPDTVTSIDIKGINTSKALESINISENNPLFKVIDGVLFSSDKKTLMGYPCGKSGSSYNIPDTVEKIEDFAFTKCEAITTINISENVKIIGNHAFSDCSSLSSINVTKENLYFCSVDGVLFDKKINKLIRYPQGKTDSSYTIPESVISIEPYAFYLCRLVEEITIPDNVTSIETGTFSSCKSLRKINIPDKISSIKEYAFSCCDSLEEIIIPNSFISIDRNAFRFCDSLKMVVASDNVLKQMGDEGERTLNTKSKWRNQGCCQHCGGTFKGLFSKKCSSCGKPKDY